MTILYESALATIHHAEALDVLETLDTESIDLVATDPPYGQEWRSNRRDQLFDHLDGDGADDQSREGIRRCLTELVRVAGQNRHLYIFGPSDVLPTLKVSEPVELVWDKGIIGSGDLSSSWGPQHEPITFLVSKGRHAGEAGESSLSARLRKGSILSYTRPTGRKVRHPSEKPWPLMRELVESSSVPGELVLDPFSGSGSSGVAAILTGRRCILVDSDFEYARMSMNRVKAAEALTEMAQDL